MIARHAARLGSPGRTPTALALVFCLALAGLLALRPASGTRPQSTAKEQALGAPAVRSHLAEHDFDRVITTRIDDSTTRVAFFDGPRIVLEAAVPVSGPVTNVSRYEAAQPRLGSPVGQRLPLLAVSLLVFLAAMLRRPLRHVANADALVLGAFVLPIVLLNERMVEWSAISASVLLAYLAVRCAAEAGRPASTGAGFLFGRVRHLWVGAAAIGLALLSIPGGVVSDVAFASMAGGTEILDGRLPYGTLAPGELVHGDTYPLLAYLAYAPAAVVAPVRDAFDNLDAALWVATAFALVAAAALARAAGLRAALAFVAFPPVMVAASSGSNDTATAALVALALASGSAAAMMGAAWVKLAPLALVPLWVAAARRRGRALAGAALVTASLVALLVGLGGPGGITAMIDAVSFQAERGSLMSPWAVLDAGGVQVVFQAAVIAGLAGAGLAVWRNRSLAADPRRMAALGAAILLAVQLAANYWSVTYLAWVFPLLAVALLSAPPPRCG